MTFDFQNIVAQQMEEERNERNQENPGLLRRGIRRVLHPVVRRLPALGAHNFGPEQRAAYLQRRHLEFRESLERAQNAWRTQVLAYSPPDWNEERFRKISNFLLSLSSVLENPSYLNICRELVRMIVDHSNNISTDFLLNLVNLREFGSENDAVGAVPRDEARGKLTEKWTPRQLLSMVKNAWLEGGNLELAKRFTSLLALVTFFTGYKGVITGDMLVGYKMSWEKNTEGIAFADFGDALLQTLQFSLDVHEYLRGDRPLSSFISGDHLIRNYLEMKANKHYIRTLDFETLGMSREKVELRLAELETELMSRSKYCPAIERKHYVERAIEIQQLATELQNKIKPSRLKESAYVTVLLGPPGAGKSTILKLSIATINKANNMEYGPEHEATLNPNSKWDENVTGISRIAILDDACSKRETEIPSQEVPSTMERIIRLSNPMETLAHMPEAQDKGRVWLRMMQVVVTTNAYDISRHKLLDAERTTNPLAGGRRMRAVVEVKPRPEFEDPDVPGKMDESRIPPGFNKLDAYVLNVYRMVYAGTTTAGRTVMQYQPVKMGLSTAEYTRWLAEDSRKHFKQQRDFLQLQTKDGDICSVCGAYNLTCGCVPPARDESHPHPRIDSVSDDDSHDAETVETGNTRRAQELSEEDIAGILEEIRLDESEEEPSEPSLDTLPLVRVPNIYNGPWTDSEGESSQEDDIGEESTDADSAVSGVESWSGDEPDEDQIDLITNYADLYELVDSLTVELYDNSDDFIGSDDESDDPAPVVNGLRLSFRHSEIVEETSTMIADASEELDAEVDIQAMVRHVVWAFFEYQLRQNEAEEERRDDIQDENIVNLAWNLVFPGDRDMVRFFQFWRRLYGWSPMRWCAQKTMSLITPHFMRLFAYLWWYYSVLVALVSFVTVIVWKVCDNYFVSYAWVVASVLLIAFQLLLYWSFTYYQLAACERKVGKIFTQEIPQILSYMQSSRVLVWGPGLLAGYCIIKSLVAFASAQGVQDQGLRDKSTARLDAEITRKNTWHVPEPAEIVTSGPKCSTTWAQFVGALRRSKAIVFAELPDRLPCMAVALAPQVLVVPRHWFVSASDPQELKFYQFETDPITGDTVKRYFAVTVVLTQEHHELVYLSLSGMVPRRSLVPYLLDEPLPVGSADQSVTLVTVDYLDGEMKFRDGMFSPIEKTPKTQKGVQGPGGVIQMTEPTLLGDCMGLYVTGRHSGRIQIVGLHVAGSPSRKLGFSQYPLRTHVESLSCVERTFEAIDEAFDDMLDDSKESAPGLFPTTEQKMDLTCCGKPLVDPNESVHKDCVVINEPPERPHNLGTEEPQYEYFCGAHSRQKPRSIVKPSFLSPFLERAGWSAEWGPPKFDYWQNMLTGWANAIYPGTPWRTELSKWAVRDFIEGIRPEIQRNLGKVAWTARPLDMFETCNGTGGRFINPMNMKTSAGPGLTGRKKQHFDCWEDESGRKLYKPNEELNAEFERVLAAYKRGERTFPVAKTALKDEPTELTSSKVRIFMVLMTVYNMIGRMLCTPIAEILQSLTAHSGMAVGMDVASSEWEDIHDFLADIDGVDVRDNVLAADVSKFDQKQTTQTLQEVGYIFLRIARMLDYPQWALVVMNAWFADLSMPMVIFAGALVMFKGYNLSGNCLTVVINSVTNAIYLRKFYYYLLVKKGITPFVDEHPRFNDVVHCVIYGDDFVASTTLPEFNLINYQAFMAKHGIRITDEAKNTDVSPFQNLYDVDFCKRKFRKDSSGRVHAPLHYRSTHKALMCMMDRGANEDTRGSLLAECSVALREMARHDREHFERERAILKAACEEADVWDLVKARNRTYDEWQPLLIKQYDEDGNVVKSGEPEGSTVLSPESFDYRTEGSLLAHSF